MSEVMNVGVMNVGQSIFKIPRFIEFTNFLRKIVATRAGSCAHLRGQDLEGKSKGKATNYYFAFKLYHLWFASYKYLPIKVGRLFERRVHAWTCCDYKYWICIVI